MAGKRVRPPKRKAQDPPSSKSARRSRTSAHQSDEDSSGDENETDRAALKKTEEVFTHFTSGTFNILHVGPLRITEKDTDLRRLAIAIDGSLAEVGQSKKATFRANACFLTGIKHSVFDSSSLAIDIVKEPLPESDDDDDEPRSASSKTVLSILFTSRESNGKNLRWIMGGRAASYLNLPVALWYGRKQFWELVRPVLEEKLQTSFIPVQFSSVHMQLFVGLWLCQQVRTETRQKHDDEVRLVLEVPVPKKSDVASLTTDINFEKWKKEIHDLQPKLNNAATLKSTLMRIWHEALSSASTAGDLSRAQFVKASTNSCVISAPGRMKLMKRSELKDILPTLVELTRIVERRS